MQNKNTKSVITENLKLQSYKFAIQHFWRSFIHCKSCGHIWRPVLQTEHI